MKIVRFTKSTDFDGRHYARGDARQFDDVVADMLIEGGFADVDGKETQGGPLPQESVFVEKDEPERFVPAENKKAKRGKK